MPRKLFPGVKPRACHWPFYSGPFRYAASTAAIVKAALPFLAVHDDYMRLQRRLWALDEADAPGVDKAPISNRMRQIAPDLARLRLALCDALGKNTADLFPVGDWLVRRERDEFQNPVDWVEVFPRLSRLRTTTRRVALQWQAHQLN